MSRHQAHYGVPRFTEHRTEIQAELPPDSGTAHSGVASPKRCGKGSYVPADEEVCYFPRYFGRIFSH